VPVKGRVQRVVWGAEALANIPTAGPGRRAALEDLTTPAREE
jgi:hypothetical protein